MQLNLDWDVLRVFLAVARTGSLRGAANQLHVNHATVSRAVLRLEERLGTRIFDRSQSGLSLGQAGELLLPHAEKMEQHVFDLSRKLAGVDARPAGTVSLTLPHALSQGFIMPIIERFSHAFPDIEVSLHITNSISDLSRQEADISLRIAREVHDNLVGRKLVTYVGGPYASPAYLERCAGYRIGDGAGMHWLGWGALDEPGWTAATPFPNAGQRHAFPEILPQLEAAAAGMGLTWLPCFLGDADPRLVRVPGTNPVPSRTIWLLLHSDLRNTARVRAFVDFVAEDITRDQKRFTE